MRKNKTYFFALLPIVLIIACSKSDQGGTLPPTPVVPVVDVINTFTVNLVYQLININTYELIISTSSGVVLLDTIAAANLPVSATIKTKDNLIDVTTIYYNTASSMYVAQTLKGVNPSSWDKLTLGSGYSNINPTVTTSPAHIRYINAPKFAPTVASPVVSFSGSSSTSYSYGTTIVDVDYLKHSKSNAYILFPDRLLYKFYSPQNNIDTVDLSQMDTAVKLNFTKPSQYSLSSTSLFGITDSTDFSKSVSLYNSAATNYTGADLVYPTKKIQQYQLSVTGHSNNINADTRYFGYGSSVTSSLDFPDDSYYSITSNQSANFSVKFLNISPVYYATTWTKSGFSWTLYSSPDSTQLNPQNLITSLHGQLLKTTDLTNLKFSNFIFENIPLFNYSTYLSYCLNNTNLAQRKIFSSMRFTKNF